MDQCRLRSIYSAISRQATQRSMEERTDVSCRKLERIDFKPIVRHLLRWDENCLRSTNHEMAVIHERSKPHISNLKTLSVMKSHNLFEFGALVSGRL